MGDVTILAAELGAAVPDAFAALDDDALARFTATIREAKQRRDAEISDAIDSSLRMLPPMLRPPVRRILGV